LQGPGGGPLPEAGPTTHSNRNDNGSTPVAKTTPIEFIRQVQAETRKVVWPTRRETVMTGVMVMVMTTLLGVFFFVTDSVFEMIVKTLLSFAK